MPKELTPEQMIVGSGVEWPLETHAACLDALAKLDGEIADISEQLAEDEASAEPRSEDWRLRAEKACYFKRRARWLIQEHMGEVKRQERARAHEIHQREQKAAYHTKATLFVRAARELLTLEEYRRIWARVDELASEADVPVHEAPPADRAGDG